MSGRMRGMKVWVVVGTIDYEGGEVVAVVATREDAWAAMLGCVKAWDELAIEEWEVGDRLGPDDRHFDMTRVRAQSRAELQVRDPRWGPLSPPWRELAQPDGSVVHVREYEAPG